MLLHHQVHLCHSIRVADTPISSNHCQYPKPTPILIRTLRSRESLFPVDRPRVHGPEQFHLRSFRRQLVLRASWIGEVQHGKGEHQHLQDQILHLSCRNLVSGHSRRSTSNNSNSSSNSNNSNSVISPVDGPFSRVMMTQPRDPWRAIALAGVISEAAKTNRRPSKSPTRPAISHTWSNSTSKIGLPSASTRHCSNTPPPLLSLPIHVWG